MDSVNEVDIRISRAVGVIAIGKILSAGHVLEQEVGHAPARIDATIKVECETEEQATGLALALRVAAGQQKDWGIRMIGHRAGGGRSSSVPVDGPEQEAAVHARTVTTIRAALDSLDSGCRLRAIVEWALTADVHEIALLIGHLTMHNTKRVIEQEVSRELEKRARPQFDARTGGPQS